jgi:hypothetical protein
MPKYKLILEIKNSLGEIKEIDAGEVNIDLTELSETDLRMLVSKLDPIYTSEQELSDAINNLPIEEVVEEVVPTMITTDTTVKEVLVETVAENLKTIKYESFVPQEEVDE